jgi:hypothetical protein
MDMDYAQIKEAVAAMSRTLEAHPGGHADTAAKSAIEAECRRIERAGAAEGYFASKLGDIRDHIDALYSARSGEDVQQLRVWIMSAANSITAQADAIRRNQT